MPAVDSFSTDVRRQLTQVRDERPCCRRTLLAVLLQVMARRHLAEAAGTIELLLDPGPTTRLLYQLSREFCGPATGLRLQHLAGTCRLSLPRQEFQALLALDQRAWPRLCCRRAYLRGAFLACGSLVSPRKSYHLEFAAAPDIVAKIEQVCMREAIVLKQYKRQRRGQLTAYLKNNETILDFLSRIGAHAAVLAWQEVTIEKEMRNAVQRSVNCETSNIRKTVASAQQLIDDIARMRAGGLLTGLPAPLQQATLLRESFPLATLQELAELAEPPLSKSGLNHRLRQLRRSTRAQLG